MRASIYLLFSLLALTIPAHASDELTLVYSANLDGELEPCGCTLDTDFGGILRRATYIDQLRAQQNKDLNEPVLISAGGLFAKELGSDKIKNSFILSGLEQLNYDAIGVQWADMIHGIEFLQQSSLPLTAGNWKDTTLAHNQIIRRDNHTLFFSQWLDPATSPYRNMPDLSPIDERTTALQQQLSDAKQQGMVTVLATTLDHTQAQALLDLSQVDILIIGSAYEQFSEPFKDKGTLVLQAGSRGQRLGVLSLALDDQKSITGWNHQVVELTSDMADAPRLKTWYDNYNEQLRLAFEEEIKKMEAYDQGQSPFVGEQTCEACHQQSHQTWQDTDHAKAYDDLEEVGKAFDPHCVGCHVVGYKQPGGFLSIDLTSQLAGVQCENCHGAGREHVNSGGQIQTPNHALAKEQVCSQCHVPEHSPKFTVKDYWPKIMHGKEQVVSSPGQ
ncbi:MAG: multiheme c-type cytochrome [Motiliproteus sp.]|nr:multiheme c-type cytochrome [Motiliproteus sp.]MCW9053180.1 multiheme c-type cytochrome [Motiliproteus sp.]